MATCQLNVRVERALAQRLRKAAKDRHTTPGTLVAQAIELLLAGNSTAPSQALSADSSALSAALAALALRVELLEQAKASKPAPITTAPQQQALALDGAITTGELAQRTGTNKGAWNTWASKATPGDVRHHPQAGPWRLVGKTAPIGGGPPRWTWEPAG